MWPRQPLVIILVYTGTLSSSPWGHIIKTQEWHLTGLFLRAKCDVTGFSCLQQGHSLTQQLSPACATSWSILGLYAISARTVPNNLWHEGLCPSSWWRHQMKTFSVLLAICAGNSLVSSEFPAQRPVMRSFDGFFICAWINGWVNNGEAGDLRRHHAHYDVTIMWPSV